MTSFSDMDRRLKSALPVLLVCAALSAGAYPAGAQAANGQQEGGRPSGQEWRILPGESLDSLAALFYPKDRRMQQRFVAATLAMNRETLPDMTAGQPFEQAATINIPDLRALSYQKGGSAAGAPAKRKPAAPASAGARNDAAKAAGNTNRKADAEYDVIAKRNQARQQQLEKLNRRLRSLEESSQAMKRSLAQDALPADENKRKHLKRMQAPEPVAPGGSGLGITLGILAAALLLIGFAGYRWHRSRSRGAGGLAKPDDFGPDIIKPARRMPVQSPASVPVAAPPRQNHLPQQIGSISVDEFASVVEEAKIIVAMGRTANAIKLLTDYIERHPRNSVHPWLYLLDLYRATGNQDEFAATGKRMHQTFNVAIPAWEKQQAPMVMPLSLEEFPHVTQKIVDMWGRPECRDYLQYLIQDNRGGARTGFSMDVLQEILLLLAILEVRDSLPPA